MWLPLAKNERDIIELDVTTPINATEMSIMDEYIQIAKSELGLIEIE